MTIKSKHISNYYKRSSRVTIYTKAQLQQYSKQSIPVRTPSNAHPGTPYASIKKSISELQFKIRIIQKTPWPMRTTQMKRDQRQINKQLKLLNQQLTASYQAAS